MQNISSVGTFVTIMAVFGPVILGGGVFRRTASVKPAGPAHSPVASPVRKVAGKVARAFSGNTAVKESWEAF